MHRTGRKVTWMHRSAAQDKGGIELRPPPPPPLKIAWRLILHLHQPLQVKVEEGFCYRASRWAIFQMILCLLLPLPLLPPSSLYAGMCVVARGTHKLRHPPFPPLFSWCVRTYAWSTGRRRDDDDKCSRKKWWEEKNPWGGKKKYLGSAQPTGRFKIYIQVSKSNSHFPGFTQ